jgi:hypothetical protein
MMSLRMRKITKLHKLCLCWLASGYADVKTPATPTSHTSDGKVRTSGLWQTHKPVLVAVWRGKPQAGGNQRLPDKVRRGKEL